MMGRGPRMPDVKAAGDNPCAGSPGVTCKMVGTETVNGRSCDKWEFVSSNKSEAGTMWIDPRSYPWTLIARNPAVEEARLRLDAAYTRERDVARAELKGLP